MNDPEQIAATVSFIRGQAIRLLEREGAGMDGRMNIHDAMKLCRTQGEALALYVSRVLPHDPPDEQVVECARAFMAGAEFMFTLFERMGHMSEQEGGALIDDINVVTRAFLRATTS